MTLNGTLVKIETATVGSGGAANITFTNIPQTYTDLLIVYSARVTNNAAAANCSITINGSTSSFTSKNMQGAGSASPYTGSRSDNLNIIVPPGANATTNTFGNSRIYFPNYRSSGNKSFIVQDVSENNNTEAYQSLVTGLWANNAAITSIAITPQNSGTFVQNTTATLYGISPVTAQVKATGGTIYSDTSHVYHLFTSSGIFTPTANLSCDYLVVAGGGGGGGSYGGGGGAGGLRSSVGATGGGGSLPSAINVIGSTNYAITVGAGGTGGTNGSLSTSGSASTFSTVTTVGGGKGADNSGAGFSAGALGGSGGGASYTNTTGGAGTANEGFAAGSGNGSIAAGSGGGGAGATSANVVTNGIATDGGAGVSLPTWANATLTSVAGFYAGGGGGGSTIGGANGTYAGVGGAGGGGAGSRTSGTDGISGIANTGGGGGGSGYLTPAGAGGAGGSGIVIIRYAK